MTEGFEWNIAIATPKVSHKVSKNLLSWCAGMPLLEKYESTPERREELFGIWEHLQKKLPEQIIDSKTAINMLKSAKSPALYPEIGLSKEQYIHGIKTAQLIRKRYTITDYLYTLGLLDAAIAYITD